MKIDGNSQVLRTVRLEKSMQENGVEQAKKAQNNQGVAFEKNRNDLFVEQLERIQNGENRDIDALENPGQSAKSKLEMLSNLATQRDLEELKKQGEDLEEEELDVIVTVVEKIKTQLLTYCEDFDSGMVEDLSDEKLQKLSGITSSAIHIAKKLEENNLPITEENVMGVLSAMEMLEKTGTLSEDAKEYCVKADLDLTIENLYMAKHSGTYESGTNYYMDAVGYYSKAGDGSSIEALLPQMERIIAQAGLDVNETTLAQAKWLVERQLPLTKESLQQLQALEDISNPIDTEEALEHMVDALLEGKRPSQANLASETALARGEHVLEVIENATEEQVQAVVASGEEVNIANLEKAGVTEVPAKEVAATNTQQNPTAETLVMLQDETEIRFVTARRQLEELRLQMTIESSVVMIRNGISVETESLQNLIDHLKQIEDQYYQQLLQSGKIEPTAANVDLYKEITATVNGIGQSPVEVIGSVAFARTRVTVQAVYSEGTALEEKYKQANQAYETVMTKPRSDMGDSIQKAFRNVDDILEDMGLELTTANQRAVRILGYNSLEITEENIKRVKEADLEMTTMLSNMKPGTVLQMIRDGYNPLDKTAQEINGQIQSMQEDTTKGEEDFSEFLWNLEHSQSISEEERSAYVGIYRLMHQIEKSDGAVVGALLEQGLNPTMRNIMTGIRSHKHKAMDYKIGESDGVEGNKSGSITEQIEAGFTYEEQLAQKIQSQMRSAVWDRMPEQVMDMSMEAFADYVQELQKEGTKADGYAREQLELLNQASRTEEEVLSFLLAKEQPVTIGTILGASRALKGRGGLFKDLKAYAKEEAAELEQELSKSVGELEETFVDKESAQNSYGKLMDTAKQIVNQGIGEAQITYEQMRNWKLMSSQIHLQSCLSENEDYHIPMEIAGELTSVHVQFVHSQESQAKVAISFETEFTGKIAAEFVAKEGRLEGYLMVEQRQVKERFAALDGSFRQQMEAVSSLPVNKIVYAQYGKLDLSEFAVASADSHLSGSVKDSDLYQVAKAVLGFVKREM